MLLVEKKVFSFILHIWVVDLWIIPQCIFCVCKTPIPLNPRTSRITGQRQCCWYPLDYSVYLCMYATCTCGKACFEEIVTAAFVVFFGIEDFETCGSPVRPCRLLTDILLVGSLWQRRLGLNRWLAGCLQGGLFIKSWRTSFVNSCKADVSCEQGQTDAHQARGIITEKLCG